MRSKLEVLSGWGRLSRRVCRQYRPERTSDIQSLIKDNSQASYIPRGLGRSSGDATLNLDGVVVSNRFDKFLQFNKKTGALTAQSGVLIRDVLETFLEKGWALPVMPSTKYLTLGGCVAADITGLNHRMGTFGHWIDSMTIIIGTGERVTCSRTENSDLFRATIGGMGLTGFIEDITLRLIPLETTQLNVKSIRFGNVAEGVRLLQRYDNQHTYLSCWLDGLTGGASIGRGYITVADPKPDARAKTPYDRGRHSKLADKAANVLAAGAARILLNPVAHKVLNTLYFMKKGKGGSQQQEMVDFFFHADKLPKWYGAFGKKGMYQFECVVPPKAAEKLIPKLLQTANNHGVYPLRANMYLQSEKAGEGDLSFSMPGVALSLDFSGQNSRKVKDTLRKLTDMVVASGGRLNLLKDATLRPEQFQLMYPKFQDFVSTKKDWDPNTRFQSCMFARLMARDVLKNVRAIRNAEHKRAKQAQTAQPTAKAPQPQARKVA